MRLMQVVGLFILTGVLAGSAAFWVVHAFDEPLAQRLVIDLAALLGAIAGCRCWRLAMRAWSAPRRIRRLRGWRRLTP